MCGIAGIISFDSARPIDEESLARMSQRMQHRGPDGDGVWISSDHQAALAHRRLAIVDLSDAGHQPMCNQRGTTWVTFNGEIYNHNELRQELQSQGHVFRSRCDTEVLVHMYDQYGPRMVERLDGDFAFLIWDEEKKEFFAARDRMGVKPFYYTVVNGHFIFSSELSSLVAHRNVDTSLDAISVFHYLTYLVAPAPRTLIKNIQKLTAGSTLRCRRSEGVNSISVRSYWRPISRFDTATDAVRDQSLETLMSRSVEKRLMSDVPIGVLFSGGVDSTLNTAIYNKISSGAQVRTYTVAVKEDKVSQSEAKRAAGIAKQLETEHYEKIITEQEMLDSLDAIIRTQDEPISDPVAIPLYHICQCAKDTGTTVLHAGEGADEMFCGYASYRKFLRYYKNYWGLLKRCPSWVQSASAKVVRLSGRRDALKIVDIIERARHGQELFLSAAVAFYDQEKGHLLDQDFRDEIACCNAYDVVKPFYEELYRDFPNATQLQRMTFIESQLRLPELLLMRVDKMSMAHGVEVRVPFLDRDVVDFALASPDDYKLKNGISKEPLKKLVEGVLGKEETYAQKRGFGTPIDTWMDTVLGQRLREVLKTNGASWSHIFDINMLRHELDKNTKHVNQGFQRWVILNLMLWHDSLTRVE